MTLHQLPLLNASLNGLSAFFILMAWYFIKHQRPLAHASCMITALITSSVFLTCYLIYHFNIPGHHVAFTAQGWPRLIYFLILFTHLPLALAVVPLVIMTFIPALRQRFEQHKKIARWTLPIWLYVSVTGVLVYLMLYVFYPSTQINS
jgi:putative membrane protein